MRRRNQRLRIGKSAYCWLERSVDASLFFWLFKCLYVLFTAVYSLLRPRFGSLVVFLLAATRVLQRTKLKKNTGTRRMRWNSNLFSMSKKKLFFQLSLIAHNKHRARLPSSQQRRRETWNQSKVIDDRWHFPSSTDRCDLSTTTKAHLDFINEKQAGMNGKD